MISYTVHDSLDEEDHTMAELRESFDEFAEEYPEIATLILKRFELDGMSLSNGMVVKIPVYALENIGTACGVDACMPFTDEIMNYFYEEADVEFVIALVLNLEGKGIPRIASMFAPIARENAEVISYLVEETGGSLRPEKCSIPFHAVTDDEPWCCFESE